MKLEQLLKYYDTNQLEDFADIAWSRIDRDDPGELDRLLRLVTEYKVAAKLIVNEMESIRRELSKEE